MENQQAITLPNGLKAVLVSRPFGKAFSACLNLHAGRRNDPAAAVGVAHLAEHLAFRGETQALYQELSEQSVYVNALTGTEHTAFYVHGHIDFFQKGIRLLASVLEVEDIGADACRHERKIVLQEMIDDEPETLADRTDRYRSFCRRLAGEPNWSQTEEQRRASMKRLTADDVNAFRRAFYRPDNAAMAIAAPVAADELKDLINASFSTVQEEEPPSLSFQESDDWEDLPEIEFCYDRWPNIWIAVVNTADDGQPVTQQAAALLGHALGGGSHSDYSARFRQDAAEAYHARTDHERWMTHTSLTSFVSVNKQHALNAIRYLIDRGLRAAEEGIDDKQRDRLIERHQRWWELRMEDPYRFTEFLAYEALRPTETSMVDYRPETFTQVLLAKEELNEAVRRLFDPANRRIFVGGRVGPLMRRKMRRLLQSD